MSDPAHPPRVQQLSLSELDGLSSFCLLGPGFGGPGVRLMRGLSECPRDSPSLRLVYAPFESDGRSPFTLDAEELLDVAVSFEGTPRSASVALHAGDHRGAVVAIRDAIAAGDVYQVCHTVRATVDGVEGADLVRLLTRRGVPRFLSWVRLPWGEEFVSASPELFFEVTGRRIRTEPMKGTAPADASGVLAGSQKDRAELAMITDLLRNDLTKVCLPRTVRVREERRLMQLAYAVQAVSDIEGELRPGLTALDALAALHPGGSVTGAPKQAALDMIARLESGPRGAYCGTLGVLDQDRATFSLLIRTAVRVGVENWVYGVGGGIVYDSDADAEMEELRIKLGALTWDIRS